MVALLLVSVLSVRSSRSRSAVDEPQESPRVSLAWLRLSLLGPGVVAEPAVTWAVEEPAPPAPPAPPPWWMGRDRGWLWLWSCSSASGSGVRGLRSCLRSWFSWLTRSSCPSSSSMRLRWVSRSLAWLSMMLFSSRRYSTALFGLSVLFSMVAGLLMPPPASPGSDPGGARDPPLPTSPDEWGGGKDQRWLYWRLSGVFRGSETESHRVDEAWKLRKTTYPTIPEPKPASWHVRSHWKQQEAEKGAWKRRTSCPSRAFHPTATNQPGIGKLEASWCKIKRKQDDG